MRLAHWIPVAACFAAMLVAAGCGAGSSARTATIPIRYSHYTNELVTVRVGEPITITIENDDPIEHEWIVGGPDVHAAHRIGTEAFHEGRANEVTVPAFSTRATTIEFDQPGDYAFTCHLPGHEAYGMTGTLRVV